MELRELTDEQHLEVAQLHQVWQQHMVEMVRAGVDPDAASVAMLTIAALNRSTLFGDTRTALELVSGAVFHLQRWESRVCATAEAATATKQ